MATAGLSQFAKEPALRKYIVNRLGSSLLALWVVTTLVFFATHLQGDPAILMVDPAAPPEAAEQLRHALGYDRPLWEQYLGFLHSLVTLDFPASVLFSRNAMTVVIDHFGPTALLAGTAILLAVIIGLPLGYLAAASRSKLLRSSISAGLGLLQAIPSFYIAIMASLAFGVILRVLPTGGYGKPTHLVLPALTLSLAVLPDIARFFRTSVSEVLTQDFVRHARARGTDNLRVALTTILPNALLPVLTIIGMQFAGLLGGAIIVEQTFSWPGLGQLMISSVHSRDYPVVLADVMFIATLYVLINFLADLAYGLVDPRVTVGR